jgi:hypothetical protein
MASNNNFGEIMLDWDGLLRAAEEFADLLGGAEQERQTLASAHSEALRLKGLQELYQARKQEATQQLGDVVAQGKEIAIRLRFLVRGRIGHQDERLTAFGMRPVRKRKGRRKTAAAETEG